MITFKAKTASGEIIKSALSPFNFPAGEAHIKREEQRELEPTEIAIIQPTPESIHDDLFQLAMWNETVVDELGYQTKRVLVLPYVPGARADRGTPWGLDVYSSFINRLELDQIIVFDPHSPVTEELLGDEKWSGEHTLTVVHSDELFEGGHTSLYNFEQYAGIIAPDKGAVKRAQAVADKLGLPLFKAEKKRDEGSGKLSGFTVEPLPSTGKLLLIDDICDAGGTFLGLADASGISKERLDLFVSHGVFSRNAETALPEKYGKVFTTNSYNPTRHMGDGNTITNGNFVRFDVIRLLLSKIK
jgi:ribose-phosphate pyrophosphokinase